STAMASLRVITEVETLRRSLSEADGGDEGSFARVFDAFFDIAEDPLLVDASKPARDAVLKGALERSTRKLLGELALTRQRVQMLRHAATGLLHGGFFADAMICTFFYFEQEQQGLVALNGGGVMTHFMQITVTPVPEGTGPMPGPPGKQ